MKQLSDGSEEQSSDSPISVVKMYMTYIFRALLSRQEGEQRSRRIEAFHKALHGLERFGITEEWIRYGCAEGLALSVYLAAMLNDDMNTLGKREREQWRILIVASSGEPTTAGELVNSITTFAQRFSQWLSTAAIDDIIDMRPSPPQLWDKLPQRDPMDRDLIEQYGWLTDRYLHTDQLDIWHTSSLHLEYRLRHQMGPMPFPSSALLELPISDDELNAAIANHAVVDPESEEKRLFDRIQRDALRHLEDSEYAQASALFDFFLTMYPANIEAMNASGFCLIPYDVNGAQQKILRVLSGRTLHNPVFVYNLCCCQYLSGKQREVLRTADRYWAEFRDDVLGEQEAYLWQVQNEDVKLRTSTSHHMLIEICLECANRLQDEQAAAQWERRRNETMKSIDQ
ncbi:hypothetical protein AALA48_02490 [Bifidobacterium pseudolongum]|uniref:hypothetical protein n=1 Tax=Bifidobacterium pseudolongum TaxID=1694 RepID=UPI0035135247